MGSVDPDRSYRMDDVFGIQLERFRIGSISGRNLADHLPGSEELFLSRRGIDGAVRAAAYAGLRVCGVDNHINFHFCNIIPDDLKRHLSTSYRFAHPTKYSIVWVFFSYNFDLVRDYLSHSKTQKPRSYSVMGVPNISAAVPGISPLRIAWTPSRSWRTVSGGTGSSAWEGQISSNRSK